MFRTIGLLISMVSATAAFAAENEARLLVGSYTGGGSQGIYVYRYDNRSGAIEPTPLATVRTDNPSWLTLSPDRRYLYAVNENSPGQRDEVGRVSSFALPADGQLIPVNRVKSLGDDPTHSSLAPDGKYLFVSNYSVRTDPGGTLAVVPVASDGTLQDVTQIKTHRASQVNPERQMGPHVHSTVSSPDGKFVFAQDLGADKVYIYRYQPDGHPELPLIAADPPYVDLPPGSGPRHMVFSDDGRYAYLVLEMAGSIVAFAHKNGQLTFRQIVKMEGEDAPGKNGGGAIHFSPDRRFLYATNRGTFNELLVYAVSPDSGKLTFVDKRSVDGREPREFAFDPTGRRVVIANQLSNSIVVIDRDVETGKLLDTVKTFAFDSPSFVQFLPE